MTGIESHQERFSIFDRPDLLGLKLKDIIHAFNEALKGVTVKGDSGKFHMVVWSILEEVIHKNNWGKIEKVNGLEILTWAICIRRIWYDQFSILTYNRSVNQDKRTNEVKGTFHSIYVSAAKDEYTDKPYDIEKTIEQTLLYIREQEILASKTNLAKEKLSISNRLIEIQKQDAKLSEELLNLHKK